MPMHGSIVDQMPLLMLIPRRYGVSRDYLRRSQRVLCACCITKYVLLEVAGPDGARDTDAAYCQKWT